MRLGPCPGHGVQEGDAPTSSRGRGRGAARGSRGRGRGAARGATRGGRGRGRRLPPLLKLSKKALNEAARRRGGASMKPKVRRLLFLSLNVTIVFLFCAVF